MWVFQTRFDLASAIIDLAAKAPYRTEGVADIAEIFRMVNRIVRRAVPDRFLRSLGRYVCAVGGWGPLKYIGRFRILSHFVFSLLGMRGSGPPQAKSIDGGIILRRKELYRGCSITCEGSAIETYARKITRGARSTLAAESTDVANNAELALRHHANIYEIIWDVADCRPIDSESLSL